jgi:hypothetical protein
MSNHPVGRRLYASHTRGARSASDSRGRLLNVREFIVKVREVWKRFTCYHCLRKEHEHDAFVPERGQTSRIRSKRRRWHITYTPAAQSQHWEAYFRRSTHSRGMYW